MDRNAIKEFVSHSLPFFSTGKGSGRLNAHFHWKLLFGGFLTLNILILLLSLYLFLQINEGDIFLVEQNQEIRIETIDRNMLNETIAFFESKNTRFESNKLLPLEIPDPSR
ncbi:hypothetical protein HYW58_02520 [Candidatus Kaiserbacteria bacterium]|nr:hypothetical protein [Candidatus Kaiserbacteria bacterium]